MFKNVVAILLTNAGLFILMVIAGCLFVRYILLGFAGDLEIIWILFYFALTIIFGRWYFKSLKF